MLQPPTWISAESWQAFHDMRRKVRAPLTPYAEKLIIAQLVRLKSAGHDPQCCLDQSIMLGWRDVFPVRDKGLQCARNDVQETREMMDGYAALRVNPDARRRALDIASAAIKRMP